MSWFCFELYVLLAGTFSPASLASASILMNMFYFHEAKKQSFFEATCALVGNRIGAMRPVLAKRCYRIITWSELIINANIVYVFIAFRR